MNLPLRKYIRKTTYKKEANVSNSEISKFFGAKDPFKRDVVH
jgi:hypothetical protein